MFKILLHWFFNFNFEHYRPANCLPDHCFCEAVNPGFACQPVNSYSNIFFVLTGIFILLRLKRNKKSTLKMSFSDLPQKLLLIFGMAQILVGIGSFIYHASFTFVGQEMDDDGMYFISSFMLLYSLSRYKKISVKQFLLYYLGINLVCEAFIYFFPVLFFPAIRGLIFGVMLLISLILEFIFCRKNKNGEKTSYLYLAIGSFLIGYLFWVLDDTRILCYPHSWFQAHSLWHFFSAVSGLMMYFYMDSNPLKIKIQKRR